MKKAQIITISVCVLGGLALFAASWVLLRGVLRFNEASRSLEEAKLQLTGFYREPVFPSAENVKREQENTAQISDWFEELIATLREGNVVRTERSPSLFKSILEKAQERLKQDASAAGTQLPEGFAFGFDRYTATGTLPAPDHVPRLTEQLILITRISKILFDQRVKGIRVLERSVFEEAVNVETSSTPEFVSQTGGRRAAAGRQPAKPTTVGTSASAVALAGIIPEGALFGTYRFVLEFDSKETALIKIFNALASCQAFTIVNVVRLSKEIPNLMPTVTDVPVAQPGETDKPAASVQLGPNNTVSGLEMEIPIRVRVELDVYKFKGDSNESGE